MCAPLCHLSDRLKDDDFTLEWNQNLIENANHDQGAMCAGEPQER
jgi:hypothetical protein